MSSALPCDANVGSPSSHASSPDEVVATWSVHLMRGRKGLARITFCLTTVLFCGLLLFHNLWLALLPSIALLLSLSEYLFPITYTLTRKHVQARYGFVLLEMPWRDVKHAYLTETGIKLSPLKISNSRFEAMRGIFLHYGNAEPETVMAAVQNMRREAAAHG